MYFLALGKKRQENKEFKVSLDYYTRLWSQNIKKGINLTYIISDFE